MSFLVRTSIRSIRTVAPLSHRTFTTTLQAHKSATETLKDGLKSVDRAVADKLVDGIEVGQKASEKTREVAGMETSEMKSKAFEMKGKASEMAGHTKGRASEVAGDAKGTAHEMAGKAKGKMNEGM